MGKDRAAFGTRNAGHANRDSAFVLTQARGPTCASDLACDESRITNAQCRDCRTRAHAAVAVAIVIGVREWHPSTNSHARTLGAKDLSYVAGLTLCMATNRISFVLPTLLGLIGAGLAGCAGTSSVLTPVGARPDGWRAEATLAGRGGEGGVPAQWWFAPKADGTPDEAAPHITVIPLPQDQTYNIFWKSEPRLADVAITVRVQARSGVVDQGGGPMWRVQDRDNYYICRANPLESNFRVYKVVGGVRTQLGSVKVDMPAAKDGQPGAWHTITVTHIGDRIVCTLDGGSRLEAIDNAIAQPGGSGVWTKADAVTWFHSFSLTPATLSSPGQ